MPVHLITSGSSGATKPNWQEKYVTTISNGFEFVDGPISTTELQEHLFKIPAPPTQSYETEINLVALNWIEALAPKLKRGYILAVDYGYSREEFYAPERKSGTLQCYAKHRHVSSPLIDPGNIDITSHVEWTSFVERAEECGLHLAGFTDQHHFMTGIATNLMPAIENYRSLQTLLHPGLLGRTFQFLGLSRSVSEEVPLSGFRLARNPRVTLGLTDA